MDHPAARVALLASLALLTACRARPVGEESSLPPEISLEGVRFRVERSGQTRTSGEAARVTYRRDTTDLVGERLSAILTTPSGPVRVSAPVAEGVVAERRFELGGGIDVVRGADRVRTERARYEPGAVRGEGRVRGDDPVEATGQGYRLTGTGFVLDPGAERITLLGRARLVAGLRGRP